MVSGIEIKWTSIQLDTALRVNGIFTMGYTDTNCESTLKWKQTAGVCLSFVCLLTMLVTVEMVPLPIEYDGGEKKLMKGMFLMIDWANSHSAEHHSAVLSICLFVCMSATATIASSGVDLPDPIQSNHIGKRWEYPHPLMMIQSDRNFLKGNIEWIYSILTTTILIHSCFSSRKLKWNCVIWGFDWRYLWACWQK